MEFTTVIKSENSLASATELTVVSVPRIESRDVSLAYDDHRVLDDVSFTVAPGEMKVMLGESGGGKSSVIRLALGLEKADSGRIFVAGEEITQLPEEELDSIRERRRVS